MADTYLNVIGKPIKLVDNTDGTYALKVDTTANINVGAVTATDVTIRDNAVPNNKLVVDTDGRIAVKFIDTDGTEVEPSTSDKQDALAALIGEVQATPTANTVLARLNSLEAKIDGIISGTTPATAELTGCKLVEQYTSEDADENGDIAFASEIYAIDIYHNETGESGETLWQVFNVNGLDIAVPPGGYRVIVGGTPSDTVTIPEGVSCIVGRLI